MCILAGVTTSPVPVHRPVSPVHNANSSGHHVWKPMSNETFGPLSQVLGGDARCRPRAPTTRRARAATLAAQIRNQRLCCATDLCVDQQKTGEKCSSVPRTSTLFLDGQRTLKHLLRLLELPQLLVKEGQRTQLCSHDRTLGPVLADTNRHCTLQQCTCFTVVPFIKMCLAEATQGRHDALVLAATSLLLNLKLSRQELDFLLMLSHLPVHECQVTISVGHLHVVHPVDDLLDDEGLIQNLHLFLEMSEICVCQRQVVQSPSHSTAV
mmetsp:Transcript_36976/g.98514  ORF Transcript_36976/g.98514 Transcript_36976/m.98514 type:complete len:267 (+) Transcript_36976:160-960(+)